MSSNPEHPELSPNPNPPEDDRGDNLGCGIALIVGGGLMLAQRLGWIKDGDWLWPCVLIGLGVSYLYKVFRRG
jgi:Domain of unknown function (DUF5668)